MMSRSLPGFVGEDHMEETTLSVPDGRHYIEMESRVRTS